MSDTPNTEVPSTDAQVDQAVAQGGAYDVLRRRLDEQGTRLRTVVEALNARRLQEFGASRMEAIGLTASGWRAISPPHTTGCASSCPLT